MKKIAITTGDQDGVGPEVTVKALLKRGPRGDILPVVFRSKASDREFSKLGRRFKRHVVGSLGDALDLKAPRGSLIEIIDGTPAPRWVESAARACLTGDLQGLVTGPLSKTLIRKSGMRDLGHTEILARLSGRRDLFQAYLGRSFNVVLATAHLPLKDVPKKLNAARLAKALRATDGLRRRLGGPAGRRPIGVLALNPHAGEEGLIGREEKSLSATLKKLKRGIPCEGPLIPDAAFDESNWRRYSVYLAAYHDQGLIPFKMLHGRRSGAQMTLGLPFVRTSVDHGTAKDIAGRGRADAGSMTDAIEWCLKLS